MNIQKYSYEQESDVKRFIKPRYVDYRYILTKIKKINGNFV